MAVRGVDHVAIPAADCEGLIAFYRRLGFAILDEERWRAGEASLFAIGCGDQKINVHPPALWTDQAFTLRAPAARPGCGDFCFVWDGDLPELQEALAAAGAPIELGPVTRVGGRGGGTTVGTSLYTRDPDGNLLEFILYP